MKDIEFYINCNKDILAQFIKDYEEMDASKQNELQRLKSKIDKTQSYIKGLEDAKRFIEEDE